MGAESSHLGMTTPTPDFDDDSPARRGKPVASMSDRELGAHLFNVHGLNASSYGSRVSDETTHARAHLPGWVSGATGEPITFNHTH